MKIYANTSIFTLNFQLKKIVDNNFDKLPLHGLGKGYSSNWWKALAGLLMAHGNNKENLYLYANISILFHKIMFHPFCNEHTVYSKYY